MNFKKIALLIGFIMLVVAAGTVAVKTEGNSVHAAVQAECTRIAATDRAIHLGALAAFDDASASADALVASLEATNDGLASILAEPTTEGLAAVESDAAAMQLQHDAALAELQHTLDIGAAGLSWYDEAFNGSFC